MPVWRISRHDFLTRGIRGALAAAMIPLAASCGGSAPATPTTNASTSGSTAASAATPAPSKNTASQAATATAIPAAQSSPAASGSVTLTLFGGNGLSDREIDFWKENIIAPYEKENPNIKINFVNADTRKLQVDLAGNLPPDVIDIETKNLPAFASRGAIADVTDRVKTSNVNQSDYSGPDMQKVIFNGKWYAIPWDTAPAVIYYNKKLFDQAGVKYPPSKWGTDGWDWTAFLDTAHKLTSGSGPSQIFGWGPTNWWVYWNPWAWANGGDFTDRSGTKITITDPPFREGWQFYANLILKEKVAPTPSQASIGVSQMFYTGKIAMMSSGSYFMVGLDKAMGTDWDIAAYPKAKQLATRSPADCHCLAKNGKNQDEAWKMVLWLTGPTGQKNYAKGGYTPVLKSVLQSDEYLKQNPHVHYEAITQPLIEGFTHHTPVPIIYPQVNDLFTTPMNNVLRGSTTVEQVLKDLQPQIQKLLDEVPEAWRGVA